MGTKIYTTTIDAPIVGEIENNIPKVVLGSVLTDGHIPTDLVGLALTNPIANYRRFFNVVHSNPIDYVKRQFTLQAKSVNELLGNKYNYSPTNINGDDITPIIPVKLNGTNVNTNVTPGGSFFTESVMADRLFRMLNMSLDDMTTAIDDNPDSQYINDVHFYPAINPVTIGDGSIEDSVAGTNTLEFITFMQVNERYDKATQDNKVAALLQYNADLNAYLIAYNINDQGGNVPQPPYPPPLPTGDYTQKSTVVIDPTARKVSIVPYNQVQLLADEMLMTYRWRHIEEEVISGTMVNDFEISHEDTGAFTDVAPFDYSSDTGDDYYGSFESNLYFYGFYFLSDATLVVKERIDATSYRQYRVVGFEYTSEIAMGGNASHYQTYNMRSTTFVPSDIHTVAAFPLMFGSFVLANKELGNQLIKQSYHLHVDAIQIVHLKWYQEGIFLKFVKAIGIVLAIFTFGKSLIFTKGLTAFLISLAIAVAEIALSNFLIKWLYEETENVFLTLLIAVALPGSKLKLPDFSQIFNIASAQQLVQFVSQVTEFVSVAYDLYAEVRALELTDEYDYWKQESEARQLELEEALGIINNDSLLDPFYLQRRMQPYTNSTETPTAYYNRSKRVKNLAHTTKNFIHNHIDSTLSIDQLTLNTGI